MPLLVYRFGFLAVLIAGFFGIIMLYYALTATLRGEYKYSEEATNNSLASIIFNLIAGGALLALAVWLSEKLQDWQ